VELFVADAPLHLQVPLQLVRRHGVVEVHQLVVPPQALRLVCRRPPLRVRRPCRLELRIELRLAPGLVPEGGELVARLLGSELGM
jgi:hypothetical protein